MTDLISPKARKIAGLVITLIVAVLAVAMEWQDLGSEFVRWTGRVFAILVVVSNALGLSVTTPKVRPIVSILALLCIGGMVACNPYSVAWRTLDGVQQARALTAQQLASVARTKHEACLHTHGKATDGYRVCIEPTWDMLRHWQHEARPAIIAAVQITASSLQIAEKVKADKKVKWVKLISPALCALSRVVKLYSVYLPDGGDSIRSVVALAEGVTCNGR